MAMLEEREIPELLRFRDLDARIRSVGINWTRQGSGVGGDGRAGTGRAADYGGGVPGGVGSSLPCRAGRARPLPDSGRGKAGPRARGVRCRRGQQTV